MSTKHLSVSSPTRRAISAPRVISSSTPTSGSGLVKNPSTSDAALAARIINVSTTPTPLASSTSFASATSSSATATPSSLTSARYAQGTISSTSQTREKYSEFAPRQAYMGHVRLDRYSQPSPRMSAYLTHSTDNHNQNNRNTTPSRFPVAIPESPSSRPLWSESNSSFYHKAPSQPVPEYMQLNGLSERDKDTQGVDIDALSTPRRRVRNIKEVIVKSVSSPSVAALEQSPALADKLKRDLTNSNLPDYFLHSSKTVRSLAQEMYEAETDICLKGLVNRLGEVKILASFGVEGAGSETERETGIGSEVCVDESLGAAIGSALISEVEMDEKSHTMGNQTINLTRNKSLLLSRLTEGFRFASSQYVPCHVSDDDSRTPHYTSFVYLVNGPEGKLTYEFASNEEREGCAITLVFSIPNTPKEASFVNDHDAYYESELGVESLLVDSDPSVGYEAMNEYCIQSETQFLTVLRGDGHKSNHGICPSSPRSPISHLSLDAPPLKAYLFNLNISQEIEDDVISQTEKFSEEKESMSERQKVKSTEPTSTAVNSSAQWDEFGYTKQNQPLSLDSIKALIIWLNSLRQGPKRAYQEVSRYLMSQTNDASEGLDDRNKANPNVKEIKNKRSDSLQSSKQKNLEKQEEEGEGGEKEEDPCDTSTWAWHLVKHAEGLIGKPHPTRIAPTGSGLAWNVDPLDPIISDSGYKRILPWDQFVTVVPGRKRALWKRQDLQALPGEVVFSIGTEKRRLHLELQPCGMSSLGQAKARGSSFRVQMDAAMFAWKTIPPILRRLGRSLCEYDRIDLMDSLGYSESLNSMQQDARVVSSPISSLLPSSPLSVPLCTRESVHAQNKDRYDRVESHSDDVGVELNQVSNVDVHSCSHNSNTIAHHDTITTLPAVFEMDDQIEMDWIASHGQPLLQCFEAIQVLLIKAIQVTYALRQLHMIELTSSPQHQVYVTSDTPILFSSKWIEHRVDWITSMVQIKMQSAMMITMAMKSHNDDSNDSSDSELNQAALNSKASWRMLSDSKRKQFMTLRSLVFAPTYQHF